MSWQQEYTGVTRRVKFGKLERFGRFVERRLPANAVIMYRDPWEMRFYCPSSVKTVALPWTEDPRELLGIARYYGVTHFAYGGSRPGIDRYLEGGHPAFKPVRGSPIPLYAIDWAAFQPGEVRLPHEADAPARSDDDAPSDARQ